MDQKYYVSNKMMDWLNKHKEKHHKKENMYGYNIPDPKGASGTLSARYYKDGAEILIKVPSATRKGYETAQPGDSVNLQQINSKTRRGRVGKKIMNTLDTSAKHVVVYKPKKISKTKNNYQHERIYEPIVSTSLNSGGGGWGANTGLYKINKTDIRRLTPKECERLQGFPDGYTEGFSDTQRYKTLGNAVTVNVVTSLINKMFGGTEYDKSR